MSYWDVSKEEQDRLDKAGVDYDVSACLQYNPQPFDLSDIEKVLAVHTGENDGDDWRWVVKLTARCGKEHGGRYVFLQGGCDYTGWDCQSWATSTFAKTALKAAEYAKGDVELKGSSPVDAGLGHMLNMLSGSYLENAGSVYDELVAQIKATKKQTWREKKDAEFGTKDLPKIRR